MGMMWYPGAWDTQGRAADPWMEIAVPSPGYGEIQCTRLDDRFVAFEDPRRGNAAEFVGERIGALLDALTQLALGTAGADHISIRASRGMPLLVARDEAAELLPTMQKAVALAIGGADRFERVWVESDSPTPGQLCAKCNQGSPYSTEVTHSDWCEQYGHTPFGELSGSVVARLW